jgi:hypothetical protein
MRQEVVRAEFRFIWTWDGWVGDPCIVVKLVEGLEDCRRTLGKRGRQDLAGLHRD